MKIIDILNLLKTNKLLAILTPNHLESNLLYDRFRISGISNLKIIDNSTLEINGSRLLFIVPGQECLAYTASQIVVEFPNSIPFYIFNKLPPTDVVYVHSEIM